MKIRIYKMLYNVLEKIDSTNPNRYTSKLKFSIGTALITLLSGVQAKAQVNNLQPEFNPYDSTSKKEIASDVLRRIDKKENDMTYTRTDSLVEDIKDEVEYTTCFAVVQSGPLFHGDLNKYLTKNLKYPQYAIDSKIEGNVIVRFVISETGEIGKVDVVRSVHPVLDAEAVRIIQGMPTWTPANQRGRNIKVTFTVPIVFRLSDRKE